MAEQQAKVKTVASSRSEVDHFVRSTHINGMGRLFGGCLLQWIDEIAGTVARRHSEHMCTTAAIDHLDFKDAVLKGSLVVCVGRLTWVGHTSMEIRVDSYVENLDGSRKLINVAYLVYVALDENQRPAPVPPLTLTTDEERQEWENAVRRNALRKERRKEGY